jgi:predicted GNAT superfamily acetyltransferase
MTEVCTVVPLTSNEELREVLALQRAAWGLDDLSLVPPHIFIAISKAGGMVLGAYSGSKLVGFILGIVSRDDRDGSMYLTSHMMGVHPEWQSRNVGFTLKRAQGTWARTHGIPIVRWTFDPMETRNANLNIRKLGGRVIQFVPDYYGTSVGSDLQRGLPSDRFVVEWNTELEEQINSPRKGELTISLSENTITPRLDLFEGTSIQSAQIPVPLNFQQLKQTNFERAAQWQRAVGAVCSELLRDRTMWISGFHRDTSAGIGYYVITLR